MNSHLNFIGVAALLGFIPLVFALFALYRPRHALLAAYIIGWLMLPMSSLVAPGKIELSKLTLPNWLVLINILLYDAPRVFRFRPHLIDLPILLWLICPLFSSMENGLGAYDGLATINYNIKIWGIPYLVGRIYFNDFQGLRDIAVSFVIGGLLYLPLVAYELRMSPVLHLNVYGFRQLEFAQIRREGGFRPIVFMQHGLALTMWMGATALAALGLWLCKMRSVRLPLPWWICAFVLLGTVAMCRSLNSLALTMGGAVILISIRYLKWPILLIMLALVPPAYIMTRCSQDFTGQSIVEFVKTHVNEERAKSFQYRLDNEKLFIAKALQQPYVGWGGWDFYPTDPETGHVMGTPDGLWIIVLSKHGSIGLGSLCVVLILPALLLAWRSPRKGLAHPVVMPATIMATIAGVHMVDCLANAMVNPLFIIGVGGVTGLCATRATWMAALKDAFRGATIAPASRFPVAPIAGSIPTASESRTAESPAASARPTPRPMGGIPIQAQTGAPG